MVANANKAGETESRDPPHDEAGSSSSSRKSPLPLSVASENDGSAIERKSKNGNNMRHARYQRSLLRLEKVHIITKSGAHQGQSARSSLAPPVVTGVSSTVPRMPDVMAARRSRLERKQHLLTNRYASLKPDPPATVTQRTIEPAIPVQQPPDLGCTASQDTNGSDQSKWSLSDRLTKIRIQRQSVCQWQAQNATITIKQPLSDDSLPGPPRPAPCPRAPPPLCQTRATRAIASSAARSRMRQRLGQRIHASRLTATNNNRTSVLNTGARSTSAE